MSNAPGAAADKPDIPPEIVARWQTIVDLMADIANVAAGVLTRLHPTQLEVLLASQARDNPYRRGGTACLNSGLCCETVIARREQLLIPNARADPDWAQNPNIALGLTAYLGQPLLWPNGDIFGTLCLLDRQENPFSETCQRLLRTFKEAVDADLKLLVELAERKRAEERLREAATAADAASRAKSAFLANMSHELRTPLNAVIGFTQLLLREPDTTALQRERLQVVKRGGEHLLSLINDVLELSRIEAGRVSLFEGIVDLGQLLGDLRAMLSPRARDKGLTLLFLPSEDLPPFVRCDERKLRQVLINLLGNAIKFTERGGVTLQAALIEDEWPRLRFDIEDSGPGIAKAEIDAIFDPFVRATAARGKEGTGLGLALSRQFARLMGGDITVTSEEGRGARFRFELIVTPADGPEVSAKEERRICGLAPGEPVRRILVVDDVEENRMLLGALLRPLGFLVSEVSDGAAAIAACAELRPHLIWMDIRLPVLDGYETTRRLRAAGSTAKIIALTASAFAHDLARVRSCGCDDVLRKPFHTDEIFDKLRQHLGVRFCYENVAPSSAPAEPPLCAADLATQPISWLLALHRAAIEADVEQTASLIEEARVKNPALGERLAQLLSDFRFEVLADLSAPG